MFDPIKEVPSLELCKRLKELGYPQKDGGYYWIRKISPEVEYELVFINTKDFPAYCPLFDPPLDPDEFRGECYVDGECKLGVSFEDRIKCEINPLIKAPTCRELGEWIDIAYQKHITSAYLTELLTYAPSEIEPNRLAEDLIWLVENGYVKFKKED